MGRWQNQEFNPDYATESPKKILNRDLFGPPLASFEMLSIF